MYCPNRTPICEAGGLVHIMKRVMTAGLRIMGDRGKAKDIQAKEVHRLGNLTLTAFNQHVSNFSVEKKRDRKDKEERPFGYKNGLYLNKELANLNSWNESEIMNRTEILVKEALHLFTIPEEQVSR